MKKAQGVPEKEILRILQSKSRDNSRTPVQWTDGQHAGFTSGTPWIPTARNYPEINVASALADNDSVFYHYKKLVSLRKEYDIITYGDYELILEDHPEIFAYIRNGQEEKLLVVTNFYGKETQFVLPETIDADGYEAEVLFSKVLACGHMNQSFITLQRNKRKNRKTAADTLSFCLNKSDILKNRRPYLESDLNGS
jgi:trehalose-6-phosphate hydrolase